MTLSSPCPLEQGSPGGPSDPSESAILTSHTDATLASDVGSGNGMEAFHRFQSQLQLFTLVLAVPVVVVTAVLWGLGPSLSLALGAACALLYLRLLGRSVASLGPDSRGIGKIQLLVPIVLVLGASRLPQLQLLPALLGFLLYKPAVILQALLEA